MQELWLLDNDGADDIYYAELEAMGYNKQGAPIPARCSQLIMTVGD